MKKKVAVIVLAVIMAFSCSFGLTACGGNGEGGEHTHTYSQQWTSDETNHWHVCTECGEAEEKSPHKFGENNICEICGYERQQEEHVHAKPGDADYVITESTHGYTCSCGVVITEEHTFGADGKCTECGYEAHEHSRPDNATLTPSDTGHSYTCSCGETVEEVHNFDTENVCKVCGYALNPSEGLAFAEKDGEYTLEGIGTFSGTELRIPYYYDGNPVTEIAEQAFYQRFAYVRPHSRQRFRDRRFCVRGLHGADGGNVGRGALFSQRQYFQGLLRARKCQNLRKLHHARQPCTGEQQPQAVYVRGTARR